jgi:hypothetical protein
MKTTTIFISFTGLSAATVSLMLLVVNRPWASEQSQGTSSVINGRAFEPLESDKAKGPSNGSQLAAESGTNLWRERVMLPLAKGKWWSTAVFYTHTNMPGPWAEGNCLSFEANSTEVEGRRGGIADVVRWRVFNIHAENFYEITRRLGLTSVEAEVVHKRLVRQTIKPCRRPEMDQMLD